MISTTYIETINEDIINNLFNGNQNDEIDTLIMLIKFFNENFDFSIYEFYEDNCSNFLNVVRDFDELVEFGNFYKSVNGDLSDCYFITEAMSPVTFVESTDELIDGIKVIVSSSLSKEESIQLNNFLVKNFTE